MSRRTARSPCCQPTGPVGLWDPKAKKRRRRASSGQGDASSSILRFTQDWSRLLFAMGDFAMLLDSATGETVTELNAPSEDGAGDSRVLAASLIRARRGSLTPSREPMAEPVQHSRSRRDHLVRPLGVAGRQLATVSPDWHHRVALRLLACQGLGLSHRTGWRTRQPQEGQGPPDVDLLAARRSGR